MKNILFILLLLTIVSCNKNQKVQKTISGKWQFQGTTTLINGIEEYTSISYGHSVTYEFQKCNLKHNDYCSLIITSDSDTMSLPLIYSKIYTIYGDGTIAEIKNNLTDSTEHSYLITDLDDHKLIFTHYENGSRVDLDFYKIE